VKVSVIVTTYKDLVALGLTLDGLSRQDYDNFEVVVAEDDDSSETVEFLKQYKNLEIVHVSHPDIGRTKTVIQNKAVVASHGEYLIFLDGDVIPYSKFISSQVKISKKGQILAGRRVNLNEKISQNLRDNKVKASNIEKYYWFYALGFMFDKETRFEQGFYISPSSFIYKIILDKRKRNISILGCNWSCFKNDFIAINGFDEGYNNTSIAEDTDLDWRFKMAGYTVKSSKNIANMFHLYHLQSDFLGGFKGKEQMNQKINEKLYICKNGIEKYEN